MSPPFRSSARPSPISAGLIGRPPGFETSFSASRIAIRSVTLPAFWIANAMRSAASNVFAAKAGASVAVPSGKYVPKIVLKALYSVVPGWVSGFVP